MKRKNLLKEKNIIGGELQCHINDRVYRGPIESIEVDSSTVCIKRKWVAELDPGTGKWANYPFKILCLNISALIFSEAGKGRLSFEIPGFGVGIITPKGGARLDPGVVAGLNLKEP